MPRPSPIRRIAKWSGVVVCVVLVAGWAISHTWGVSCNWGHTHFGLEFGRLLCQLNVPHHREIPAHCEIHSLGDAILLWPIYGDLTIFPVWYPLIGCALPTAYLFWRDRRHPRGHCQGCGYNLTGNESGVCPECGRAT